MSVVAGCSLLNGVLLMADSRLTIWRRGLPNIYVDDVQKVFLLPPRAAIGFVGDLQLAQQLLKGLLDAAASRPRLEAMTPYQFIHWVKRYLRHKFNRATARVDASIAFILAIADPRFPNTVEREPVRKLIWDTIHKDGGGHLNGIFMQFLSAPPEIQFIQFAESPKGMLVHYASPDFTPWYFHPMSVHAIGSGEGVLSQLMQDKDHLMLKWYGMPDIEMLMLQEIVDDYIRAGKVDSIGGLCIGARVDSQGPELQGFSVERRTETNLEIELKEADDGHWVQRNVTTGREVRLLHPWEVDINRHGARENRFDDFLSVRDEGGWSIRKRIHARKKSER